MREALPARPGDGLLEVAGELQHFCAVAEPEEERDLIAVLQQLPVGAEELREEAVEEGVVLAEERLRTELERSVPEERIGGERDGGVGALVHRAKARSAKSSAHAQS